MYLYNYFCDAFTLASKLYSKLPHRI